MKKIFFIGVIFLSPSLALSQTSDLQSLDEVQNRNDNARDAYILNQQNEAFAERRREEARRNEIAHSIAAQHRAMASAINEQQKYVRSNQDIDLSERRLKLQHDQVRSQHDEEFVRGELDRQKAINGQIQQGNVDLRVGQVDAD